jgi:hypothetical protein
VRVVSEAGLLNKSSCLARTLGVTKFIMVIAMDSVTLCCATYVTQCWASLGVKTIKGLFLCVAAGNINKGKGSVQLTTLLR